MQHSTFREACQRLVNGSAAADVEEIDRREHGTLAGPIYPLKYFISNNLWHYHLGMSVRKYRSFF